MEQAKEDWIIDVSPINLSEPFSPLDHVGPKSIIKIPNNLVVWFAQLHNPVEHILGNLLNFHQCSIKQNKEGNYLISQWVVSKT